LVVTEPPAGFVMDPDTVNAALYYTATHVNRHGASFHGFSVRGHGVRMAFTVTGDPRDFLDAIASDVAGYCDARFDSRGTRVEIVELSATDSLEAQMDAMRQIAMEGEAMGASRT